MANNISKDKAKIKELEECLRLMHTCCQEALDEVWVPSGEDMSGFEDMQTCIERVVEV